MEANQTTHNKPACILSITAAILLVTGGIALIGYYLNLVPELFGLTVMQLLLYSATALIPIISGVLWLGILYRRRKRNDFTRNIALGGAFFGGALIVVGLFMLGFGMGLIPMAWRSIFISWQMLLIVIGLIEMCKVHVVPSLTLIIVGMFFLVPRIMRVFPESWQASENFTTTYWPMLLIVFGILIVVSVLARPRYFIPRHRREATCGEERLNGRSDRYSKSDIGSSSKGKAHSVDGIIDYSLIFTGAEHVFLDPAFRGGNISCVFGGMELDLRRTELPEGTTYLDLSVVFGGVNITAPESWNIELRNSSVVGGYSDKRRNICADPADGRKLVITASCVFGGGEIK